MTMMPDLASDMAYAVACDNFPPLLQETALLFYLNCASAAMNAHVK